MSATEQPKPPAFERVPGTGQYYPSVHRLPVPGGWIYYIEPTHREPCAVFVPDPIPRKTVDAPDDRPLRFCDYCQAWNRKPCGDGCVWSLSDPTLEQLERAGNTAERLP